MKTICKTNGGKKTCIEDKENKDGISIWTGNTFYAGTIDLYIMNAFK